MATEKSETKKTNRKRSTSRGKESSSSKTKKQRVSKKDKVRYAVVGLGHIAQNAVLPAFKQAKSNSALVALVSSSQDKLKKLGAEYGTDALYTYDELEDCIEKEEIDVVYIAVPNSLHLEFITRSAEAGAHILCEKPLGVSASECRKIDRIVRQNRVYLMTAYRLHFDEANMRVVEILKEKQIGEPKIFNSVFSYQVAKNNIRTDADLGGGALFDIGIYAINASRYLFQEEPEEVFGISIYGEDQRFSEVDGTTSALLTFPKNRIAQFSCSFNTCDSSYFEVFGTKGKLRLENAYEYEEPPLLTIETEKGKKQIKFKKHDQFAAELLYFSSCLMEGKQPEPSAQEAEKDATIIEALFESSKRGKAIPLRLQSDKKKPNGKFIIVRPKGMQKQKLVSVSAPHLH